MKIMGKSITPQSFLVCPLVSSPYVLPHFLRFPGNRQTALSLESSEFLKWTHAACTSFVCLSSFSITILRFFHIVECHDGLSLFVLSGISLCGHTKVSPSIRPWTDIWTVSQCSPITNKVVRAFVYESLCGCFYLFGAVPCEYNGWILQQANVDLLKKQPDCLLQWSDHLCSHLLLPCSVEVQVYLGLPLMTSRTGSHNSRWWRWKFWLFTGSPLTREGELVPCSRGEGHASLLGLLWATMRRKEAHQSLQRKEEVQPYELVWWEWGPSIFLWCLHGVKWLLFIGSCLGGVCLSAGPSARENTLSLGPFWAIAIGISDLPENPGDPPPHHSLAPEFPGWSAFFPLLLRILLTYKVQGLQAS